MPDGNWIKRNASKLGFLVAATVAISAMVWGWNYGLVQERIYQKEAREAHANYTKNGCNEIAKPKSQVASVKKAESEECTPTEKAQQENDNRRDYADLVAQRSSALWAKIMGIAALIGMGLSLVGVALVWTTFRETRDANKIARESTRPFIGFESPDILHFFETRFDDRHFQRGLALGPKLKNYGQSPATKLTSHREIKLQPRSNLTAPVFDAPDVSVPSNVFLAPGQSTGPNFVLFGDSEYDSFIAQQTAAYIYISCTYSSPHTNERWTSHQCLRCTYMGPKPDGELSLQFSIAGDQNGVT